MFGTDAVLRRLRATGNYEQAHKDFIARQKMGRLATADEIAALVVYLASDASSLVTGTSILLEEAHRVGVHRFVFASSSSVYGERKDPPFRESDRVDRLILLGPMGYSGAAGAVLRIMGAQYFPLAPVQDATFRWAFSDAPEVVAEFNEWFRLLMSETLPVKVAPLPLPVEERRSIRAPTLFVFGARDNLVGDAEAARALMGVERPAEVNALILDFAEGGGPGR